MPRGREIQATPKTIAGRILIEFLKRERMTQSMFGQICGVARSTINQYISDQRRPPLEEAFRIQDATNGEVPARTWLLLLDSEDAVPSFGRRGPASRESEQDPKGAPC